MAWLTRQTPLRHLAGLFLLEPQSSTSPGVVVDLVGVVGVLRQHNEAAAVVAALDFV